MCYACVFRRSFTSLLARVEGIRRRDRLWIEYDKQIGRLNILRGVFYFSWTVRTLTHTLSRLVKKTFIQSIVTHLTMVPSIGVPNHLARLLHKRVLDLRRCQRYSLPLCRRCMQKFLWHHSLAGVILFPPPNVFPFPYGFGESSIRRNGVIFTNKDC
jgi:hypothetical protein